MFGIGNATTDRPGGPPCPMIRKEGSGISPGILIGFCDVDRTYEYHVG
jgi:hypothetical protein